ncbi:AAA family ATPase [Candidatus Woesearchaeota archaeon]|nr:AAA family ATPase [Candidatus Woesearchaeota archaeon]
MSYFKDFLGADESLFRNEDALDLEWLPKVIPYREEQQQHIATCIKPLLAKRNGKNLFIYGDPGIGKTAATRSLLRDLEETTDEVEGVYINCWQKNTSYKVCVEICHLLGYKFTQNKNTEEIFAIIKNIVNKKAAVFVFDETDKIEDFDFLYSILNDIYRKTVIVITNYKEWLGSLEPRIRSRLMPDMLEFKKYSVNEIEGILKQRIDYAFVPGVWTGPLIRRIAEKTATVGDIRAGIYLLRQTGMLADNEGSKKITNEHVEATLAKLDEQGIQKPMDLDEESRNILTVIKELSPRKIGDLFSAYKEKGGGATYKTFQRKIAKLEKAKLISTNKIIGGKEGTTTVITYGRAKTLSDF